MTAPRSPPSAAPSSEPSRQARRPGSTAPLFTSSRPRAPDDTSRAAQAVAPGDQPMTKPTIDGIDLLAATWGRGVPHDQFDRMRQEAPVCWHPEEDDTGFW